MKRILKWEIEINTDNQVTEAIVDTKLQRLKASLAQTKAGDLAICKMSSNITDEIPGDDNDTDKPLWAGAYLRVMDQRIAGYCPVWLVGFTRNGDGYAVKAAYPMPVCAEVLRNNTTGMPSVQTIRYETTYGSLFNLKWSIIDQVVTDAIRKSGIKPDFKPMETQDEMMRQLTRMGGHLEMLSANLTYPVLEVTRCTEPVYLDKLGVGADGSDMVHVLEYADRRPLDVQYKCI